MPTILNNADKRREAAIQYTQLKLPIIPICSVNHHGMSANHKEICQYPGKMPIIKDWTNRDVATLQEVNQWFNSNSEINIGLILGDTSNWNLVGIDADGELGEKLLHEWSQGVIPITWEFSTGKGRRLLYRLPDGTKSKKFKKADKNAEHQELALLATGQQTIVPPSRHASGTLYQWVEGRSPQEVPIADAPLWILNRVLQYDEPGTNEVNDLSSFTDEVLSPPVESEDWTKDVGKGERNNHLTKLAGSLIARRNIPKDQVILFLNAWNHEHCQPPLPDAEIASMVEALYASEQMKHAKRQAMKNDKKEGMQPLPVAEEWVKKQAELGISWRFINQRAKFYRCDDLKGPWTPCEVLFLQQELRPYLIQQDATWGQTRHLNEVVNALKEVLADEGTDDIFDIGLHPDIKHIYCRNGMLDWQTGELKPWDTKSYSPIQLPVDWNPDGHALPVFDRWQKTLAEWIPDEGTRLFLQEFVGYCLIPDCSFRTAVFLFGGGRNGKSLFIDVIKQLFGNYVNYTTLQRVAERFETASLVDKLLNICADIDSTYLPETSVLKALIAGDTIRGEYKYGASFSFNPVSRLLFSANALPKAADKSEGWYSRWRFVEFPKQFSVDPSYKRLLLEEMGTPEAVSALLSWAVEGLRRLYKQLSFTTSEMMQGAARSYRAENDSVVGFIETALECVEHAGKETQLATSSLYKTYEHWCEYTGLKKVGQIEFVKRAHALGVKKAVRPIQGKTTNVFIGVRLKDFETDELDLTQHYNLAESLRKTAVR